MSNLPLDFHVVGQDDYMLQITIDSSGTFRVDMGDHTSHKPRTDTLSPSQRSTLMDLLAQLGEPREHPAPEGATGFMAELSVGSGDSIRRYRFWEGALDEEPDLAAVVRALEVL